MTGSSLHGCLFAPGPTNARGAAAPCRRFPRRLLNPHPRLAQGQASAHRVDDRGRHKRFLKGGSAGRQVLHPTGSLTQAPHISEKPTDTLRAVAFHDRQPAGRLAELAEVRVHILKAALGPEPDASIRLVAVTTAAR